MRIGIDSGGTFTDVVTADGSVAKVASTPDDPARAVGRAIDAVDGREAVEVLAHGTTVATNALLERRGARGRADRNAGFRRRNRDRAPGTTFAVRPLRRPPGTARSARSAIRGGGPARRARRGDRGVRGRCSRRSPERSTRSRCASCTPISIPRHEREVADALRKVRARARGVLARGESGVPRVRAHGHDGRRGVPRARVRAVPDAAGRARAAKRW